MKRLILMASLFASLHVFAKTCSVNDHIVVTYFIWNKSEYQIQLKFGKAGDGRNPEDIYVGAKESVTDFGCSDGFFEGYETTAALMTYSHDGVSDSDIDLAHFYIKNPFSGNGRFSFFQAQNTTTKMPECSCEVDIGDSWLEDSFDCASFIGPMLKRVRIRIDCQ